MTYYRVLNGTAVGVSTSDWKVMHPSMFHYSKEAVQSTQSSHITPKGSPMKVNQCLGVLPKVCLIFWSHLVKDILESSIMWLRDTGILDKLKNDVMNLPIPVPNPTVRHNQPLILRQLGIIMIILGVGLSIGTVVFLVELLKKPKLNHDSTSEDGFELLKLWCTQTFKCKQPA